MVSKLSDNGIAGFILANGALSGGGEEYKIRRKLIENNLVEAILVCIHPSNYTCCTLPIGNKLDNSDILVSGIFSNTFFNHSFGFTSLALQVPIKE